MPSEAEKRAADVRSDALARYDRGDEDAAEHLAAARRFMPHDGGLLIADATLRLEARTPDALAPLAVMLDRAPDWRAGHVALARLRWGAGDRTGFAGAVETALRRMPRHAGLWMTYMDLLAEAGLPGRAAEAAAGLRRAGDNAALRLIEARHRGAASDLSAAERLLADMPDTVPGAGVERARHALRFGDPGAADAILAPIRAAAPDDRTIWALTELAWRAGGDPRHAWLVSPAMLPRGEPVDLPPGLAGTLRAIHARRWPALGQSLRSGTQTRGHLADRGEPAIRATIAHLMSAQAALLGAIELPRDHPLAMARTDRRMIAAWSIRLQAGGHHVPHIHPDGLFSAVLHVAADATADGDGQLELGRPPAAFAKLGLSALDRRSAQAGGLHLFPSFLYHGTTPASGDDRLTIAFDVV